MRRSTIRSFISPAFVDDPQRAWRSFCPKRIGRRPLGRPRQLHLDFARPVPRHARHLARLGSPSIGKPDCGYPKSGLDHSVIRLGDQYPARDGRSDTRGAGLEGRHGDRDRLGRGRLCRRARESKAVRSAGTASVLGGGARAVDRGHKKEGRRARSTRPTITIISSRPSRGPMAWIASAMPARRKTL